MTTSSGRNRRQGGGQTSEQDILREDRSSIHSEESLPRGGHWTAENDPDPYSDSGGSNSTQGYFRRIMMLSEKLLKAINTQIEHELFSSNLYLSMAAYFEAKGWFVSGCVCRVMKEREHALKFFDYLHDVGAQAKIHAISEPPFEWSSALDAFEHVLTHNEKKMHEPDPQPVRDCPAGQGLRRPVDVEMVHRRAGGTREQRQPDRRAVRAGH